MSPECDPLTGSDSLGRLLPPTGLVRVRIVVRNPATRRDAVVEVRRKLRVFARTECPALATQVRITAEDPVATIDPQRRSSIVEHAVQVARSISTERIG